MPSNEKEQDLFGFNNDSEEENDLSLDEEQDSRFSKTKLQKGSLNDESDASSDEESEAEDQQEESDNDQQESDNDQEESDNDQQQEESNDEAESDDQQDQLSDMEGYDAPDNLSDFGVISTGKNKKKKKIKALTPEELEKFEKARKKTGVCYLSRIPLFMPPSRVRELLKKYADIGRIYLVPEDPKITTKRKKYTKNNRRNYIEGWVEFKDKRDAKAVAEHLNMKQIGGKRKSRYYAEMWNIKYLPKFKWHHLTEQMAYEKQARQQRLRNEIAQTSRENKTYIQNVAKAKMLESIKERKRKKDANTEGNEAKVRRIFEQREKVEREVQPVDDSVKGLLGTIFSKK
ncbi:hypothetical protein BCV72DRAFT_219418 [Rhizopus microsporus var. microsporus]|uniref:18S rRNA factor 2 n=1 Tax=Rhizopus microsporus var. microsporus TaxID=86635 RepID=A0A1X0RIJ3_RHIZD|nr:hypothetical protein BCV72DRAFT_219418 [Rhizopus microsporus var. microsporus]